MARVLLLTIGMRTAHRESLAAVVIASATAACGPPLEPSAPALTSSSIDVQSGPRTPCSEPGAPADPAVKPCALEGLEPVLVPDAPTVGTGVPPSGFTPQRDVSRRPPRGARP